MFSNGRAVSYLKDNFVPKIGLIREAPKVAPDKYWIWTDNMTAFHTLLTCGDKRDSEFMKQLYLGLKKYGFDYPYITKKKHNRMECIWGEDLDMPWKKAVQSRVVETSAGKVWNEVCQGDLMDDWIEYADLLFLGVINYINIKGMLARIFAEVANMRAMRMWDGNGFKDCIAEQENAYNTYKLALFILADKALERYDDRVDRAIELIGQLQAPTGGVWTHYTVVGGMAKPLKGCDTNTETVSLCILANLAHVGKRVD